MAGMNHDLWKQENGLGFAAAFRFMRALSRTKVVVINCHG